LIHIRYTPTYIHIHSLYKFVYLYRYGCGIRIGIGIGLGLGFGLTSIGADGINAEPTDPAILDDLVVLLALSSPSFVRIHADIYNMYIDNNSVKL